MPHLDLQWVVGFLFIGVFGFWFPVYDLDSSNITLRKHTVNVTPFIFMITLKIAFLEMALLQFPIFINVKFI